VAICLSAGLLMAFAAVHSEARSTHRPTDDEPGRTGSTEVRGAGRTVSHAELPVEAQATMRRIRTGGPHPYGKDGVVFGNRERHLPGHPRGFYKEYTVVTPGSRDRGARRIVCGGAQPAAPEACYYTADHYSSFKRIVQ
jgi:ribonuclease T1